MVVLGDVDSTVPLALAGLQKIKESMDEESLPPESQHRPESQPTPFCWDPPIVTKIQVSAPDSVPTPHAEEPIAWPALQSIPVPPVVSESVPTPWFSQPTPKVEMSDVRYISDPTPLPPTREEEALPSSSLPTPVPAEAAPRNVDSGDQTAARADAAAGLSSLIALLHHLCLGFVSWGVPSELPKNEGAVPAWAGFNALTFQAQVTQVGEQINSAEAQRVGS